mmetsp:Transcript_17283/g.47116  ORF Transcript_17283/g.47116 Transcript_17283/m.47116 type:complete len:203 (-) Transcript_17283:2537-3145(-)
MTDFGRASKLVALLVDLSVLPRDFESTQPSSPASAGNNLPLFSAGCALPSIIFPFGWSALSGTLRACEERSSWPWAPARLSTPRSSAMAETRDFAASHLPPVWRRRASVAPAPPSSIAEAMALAARRRANARGPGVSDACAPGVGGAAGAGTPSSGDAAAPAPPSKLRGPALGASRLDFRAEPRLCPASAVSKRCSSAPRAS